MITSSLRTLMLALLVFTISGCGGDQDKRQHANGGVINATISPNGHYALVASIKEPTHLWDLKNNRLLYKWRNTEKSGSIHATAFSADARFALTAEPHNISLWEVRTGKVQSYWKVHDYIKSVALGPDGSHALLGYASGNVDYIDLVDGRSVRRFTHQDKINSVDLSMDGRYGLSGSDDKSATLWNIQTGKPIKNWPHKKNVTYVLISPKSNYAVTASAQGDLYLWDMETKKRKFTLNAAPMTVSSASFSPDEKFLVVGSVPNIVKIYNIANGKMVKQHNLLNAFKWTPNSLIVYAVAMDNDNKNIKIEDSSGHFHSFPFEEK